MKKNLLVFLAAMLLLTACSDKSSTTVDESSVGTTVEETTEDEANVESKAGLNLTYVGDGDLPIVEIDGELLFAFTADEFTKALNGAAKEIMKTPSTFTPDYNQEEGMVMLTSDNGLSCGLFIDADSNLISNVLIMGLSEDFSISELAIEATPLLMVLNPNMEASYAGAHLIDIAYAAQIQFSSSQYAYQSEHDGILEIVYGEDDFIIFGFSPAVESEDEEAETQPAASGTKPDFGPLSDDVYSFQLQVNDDVYQLPMTYSQFTAFGWQYKKDDSYSLSAGSYMTTEVFKLGELSCYAEIVNFDVNERPVSECYITAITITTDMMRNTDTTVTLPGGISIGGNMEDAVAVYGTPTDEYISSRRKLTYSLDYYQSIEIISLFDDEIDTIAEIKVRNLAKPDDFEAGSISDDVPAAVRKYETPAQLSDDFGDFIVEFGGDMYQLPAPVSVFIANGWKVVESDSQATISGRNSSWVSLMRDNQKFRVMATNYDENATTIENGFVTNLVNDIFNEKTPLIIARNITVGMSKADVESALAGIDYEEEEPSSSFEYFTIYPTDSKIYYYNIVISKETGTVSKVALQHQPKYSEYINQ